MTKCMLSQSEAEQLLKEEKIGRLSTFGDLYPYIVPLCYVYYKGKIYFHCGLKGQKLDNLRRNKKVCFQADRILGYGKSSSPCSLSLDYKSVIVFGTATEVVDGIEKKEALEALVTRFSGDRTLEPIPDKKLANTNIVRIHIDNMTAKANIHNNGSDGNLHNIKL